MSSMIFEEEIFFCENTMLLHFGIRTFNILIADLARH